MDRHGTDVELLEPRTKRIQPAWRRGAALPGRRVVDEDLYGSRADLAGPFRGATQALAEGQVDTDARRVRAGQWGPDRSGGPPFV
jgi:hypothetical protein